MLARNALRLAALASLCACGEGTGAFAPGGEAERLLRPAAAGAAGIGQPAAPRGVSPELPAGHPPAAGGGRSAGLLAQVEAARGTLENAPKPLEVLVALGGLYEENGRYLDAIDWYRQAIELSEPAWALYLALPKGARPAPSGPAAKAECARREGRGFSELSRVAQARAAKGDVAAAAACWREALVPSLTARVRRGGAFLLVGNPDLALADEETALARAPDHPEALWDLALVLTESAQGDGAKLARAREALVRLRAQGPGGARAGDLALALAEIDRRMAAAQGPRAGIP